jgi:hypothetical protein
MQGPVLIAQRMIDDAQLLRPNKRILLELPGPGECREDAEALAEAVLHLRQQCVVLVIGSRVVAFRDAAQNRDGIQQLIHGDSLRGGHGAGYSGQLIKRIGNQFVPRKSSHRRPGCRELRRQ